MVIKLRLRRILIPFVLYSMAMAAIGFFAYSAYSGNRGIVAKREYKLKIAKLKQDFTELQAEKIDWERRVGLMRSQSLDLDILEERARMLLNSSHKNDVVLILDAKP